MLDVNAILPMLLTPLVLPPPLREPVCEMHTPALFTIAQASPQPQSVDAATYSRVNPLPSPITSSSSSGELPLFFGSNTSSPTATVGRISPSQELLLQGQQPVPPPPLSLQKLLLKPSQQPQHSSFWADEVATELRAALHQRRLS